MKLIQPRELARRLALPVLALAISGCHDAVEVVPLKYAVFGHTENFFDAKFMGSEVASIASNGGRLLTINGKKVERGGTLERRAGAETNPQVARLKFVNDRLGFGVGQDGAIFHTADAGKTWDRQQSGTENYLLDVDFVDENHGWAVGEDSVTVKTSDGGKSWQKGKVRMSGVGVPGEMALALESPTYYSVDFIDDKTGWVAGEYGQISVTRDGGETWTPQHGSLLSGKRRDVMFLPSFQCIRFRNAAQGVAVGTAQGKGDLGGIAFTNDGGETWQFADSPTDAPLYDIAWLPDGKSILVGSSGEALIGNGADGWKPLDMPAGTYAALASIDFDPAGRGIIAGAHGTLLASNDWGKTWDRIETQ